MAAAFSFEAACEPRVPRSEAEVLERLGTKRGDPFSRESAALQARLARMPRDLEAAVRLAHLHLERSRQTGDPRHLGRAQAALAPWWTDPAAPTPVLLARATIRQSQHDFAPALADLQEAVRREPRNSQAWLSLATLQNVTGRAREARASCERLAGRTLPVVVAGCRATIMSTRGAAATSRTALLAALEASPSAPAALQAWAHGLAGELADRSGDAKAAEASYRAALSLDPADAYTLAAYADLLLQTSRPGMVLQLLPGERLTEGLQLRRAIAMQRLNARGAAAEASRLKARFEAAARRGDRVHLREEARFALELAGDPPRALDLALENWRAQKEPADAQLVIQAAAAAGAPRRADEVVRWIRESRLEGAALEAALARLRGA